MTLSTTVLRVAALVLFTCNLAPTHGLWCDRTPVGITVPKTPGDNDFKIIISGDPDRYIPGAVYTVRLQAPEIQFTDKFSGFLLVAEPADGLSPETSSGNFQLPAESLARFSEYCPHAVRQASELPKTEVQIRWQAPESPAGCVVFKAAVTKSKNEWFMDDGALTKQLCPENEDGLDENENKEPCCACDEAKYELTFEGLWSSLTHPKDFPADTLSAHFGDVIGASHSPDYRFWEYGGEASDGLSNLAELGDTQELESELKEKSSNIRTIIKARGLKNPKFYGYKTSAVFRADKDNNLVSIVSKIVPSPDWFVGISGVNLCLPNCSWSEEKILNLYPWDAGTNDGISYTSEGEATYPKETISRIVWNGDENSPFYDEDGNIVRPFAKLKLSKQRSYNKDCETDARRDAFASDNADGDMYDESEHQNLPECQVSLWSDWGPCPVTCGRGTQTRYRNYINPAKATKYGCNRRRVDKKNCYNTGGCSEATSTLYKGKLFRSAVEPTKGQDSRASYCSTTEWTQWSQCSATCGRGRRARDRKFLYPQLAVQNECTDHLQEQGICYGIIQDCSMIEKVEPGCETTNWSEWGACSVTCGQGVRKRTRYFVKNRANHRHCNLELMEFQTCTGVKPNCSEPEDMKGICKLPKQVGMCPNSGNFSRWYFEKETLSCKAFTYLACRGNKNNFRTEQECESQCGFLRFELRDQGRGTGPPAIDCLTSPWSEWSRCRGNCGTKTRTIISYNQNGGKLCPSLIKTRQCDENSSACRLPEHSYGKPIAYNWNA
ncbi:unnamed protein product [Allacma fusca]|uniref:Spondin-1 n=1 Tax=Allacma fusca TaxID=39272 RepID=A0A8J2P7V3_9HEXA|nr:unnamed protein product [Allacma fusca]